MINVYKTVLASAIALSLTACGGGGSSSSSGKTPTPTPPANNAPTVSVESITANENTIVTITATASDADGGTLTYTWKQTSGDTVSFIDKGSFISFEAPEVTEDSEFTFEVAVSDGADTVKAQSSVSVINVPTKADGLAQLKSLYIELREEMDSNNQSNYVDGYETVGWYNTYNIDVHGDGDFDVLVTAVAHLDHENDLEIYGESYLIINHDDLSYSIESTGLAKNGRTLEIVDLNSDGLEDVYFASHGYESPSEGVYPGGQDYVWLQNNDGTFTDQSSDLIQKLDFTHGSCSGDYRNIGINDIITTYGNDVIYKQNDGNGLIAENFNNLPLLAISDNYAREHNSLGEHAPLSISHYWCAAMDLDADDDLDVVFGGRGGKYPAVNGVGENVNFRSTVIFNDGNGQFPIENVQYVEFVNAAIDNVDRGIEEAHPTGIFPLDIDGDSCSDFATYHTNYGDDVSFNVYINQCNQPLHLTYTWESETEVFCEHIPFSQNEILAWCGDSQVKRLKFESTQLTINELTQKELEQLKPSDYLKATEYR